MLATRVSSLFQVPYRRSLPALHLTSRLSLLRPAVRSLHVSTRRLSAIGGWIEDAEMSMKDRSRDRQRANIPVGWVEGSAAMDPESDPAAMQEQWIRPFSSTTKAQRNSESSNEELDELEQEILASSEPESQIPSRGSRSGRKKSGSVSDESAVRQSAAAEGEMEPPMTPSEASTGERGTQRTNKRGRRDESSGASASAPSSRSSGGRSGRRGQSNVHGKGVETIPVDMPSREMSTWASDNARGTPLARRGKTSQSDRSVDEEMDTEQAYREEQENKGEFDQAAPKSTQRSGKQVNAPDQDLSIQSSEEASVSNLSKSGGEHSGSALPSMGVPLGGDPSNPHQRRGRGGQGRAFHTSAVRRWSGVYVRQDKPDDEQMVKDIRSLAKARIDADKEEEVKKVEEDEGTQASGNIVADPELEGMFDKPAGAIRMAGVGMTSEGESSMDARRAKGQAGLEILDEGGVGMPAFKQPPAWYTDVQARCAEADMSAESRRGEPNENPKARAGQRFQDQFTPKSA